MAHLRFTGLIALLFGSACIIQQYETATPSSAGAPPPARLALKAPLYPGVTSDGQLAEPGVGSGHGFAARQGAQIRFNLDRLVAGVEVHLLGPMRSAEGPAQVSSVGVGDGPFTLPEEGTYIAAVVGPAAGVGYRLTLQCEGMIDCRISCADTSACPAGSECQPEVCNHENCPNVCVPSYQYGDAPEASAGSDVPVVESSGVEASEAPSGVCGTRGTSACDPGTYCEFDEAAACGEGDRPGRCTPIPEMCTREYRPVCGCDGQTYPNRCAAGANEVSVRGDGPC
ncbi:MAG: Kazal-type serine protease inhibitor family protein [Myxococcota bacterium]